jgi:hypothetical protein
VAWCAFCAHVAAGIFVLVYFARNGSYLVLENTWRLDW